MALYTGDSKTNGTPYTKTQDHLNPMALTGKYKPSKQQKQ